ncbi:ISYps1 transposase [Serratia sp. M24T3]|nr:ISYps1 transposase [Serratia sp. M24T3]
MSLARKAFKCLHYPADVIAQCVRWYLVYSLSLRNLEEMMAEHTKLHRWVIRMVPLLDKVFHRYKCSTGRRWRMDETYIKIRGQWKLNRPGFPGEYFSWELRLPDPYH